MNGSCFPAIQQHPKGAAIFATTGRQTSFRSDQYRRRNPMPGRTHVLHRLSSSVLREHIASYLLSILFYTEAALGTTNMKLPAIYGDMNKQDLLLKVSIDPNWNAGDANGLLATCGSCQARFPASRDESYAFDEPAVCGNDCRRDLEGIQPKLNMMTKGID